LSLFRVCIGNPFRVDYFFDYRLKPIRSRESMPKNPHRVQPIERFPAKPRGDGRFQKRINGTLYYFGSNGDRVAAIAEYERAKHRLYAQVGARPTETRALQTASIRDIANRFLFDRKPELAGITYKQYRFALVRLARFCGVNTPWSALTADDFTRFKRTYANLSGYSFNRDRAAIIAMFNYASDQDWIDRPPKYGRGFEKVSRAALRTDEVPQIATPDDLAAMLCAASRQVYAMMLLAVNGGFGPADLRALEWRMIDFDSGTITDRRAKTKIRRRVTIWPETIHALKRLKRWEGWPFVFRTRHGNRWSSSEISHQVKVAIDKSGVSLPKRSGLYLLRHTFATLANEVRDGDANKAIMGRRLTGLDDVYVATVFDPRLRAVTDHVRERLRIADLVGNVG
jgi:integrase